MFTYAKRYGFFLTLFVLAACSHSGRSQPAPPNPTQQAMRQTERPIQFNKFSAPISTTVVPSPTVPATVQPTAQPTNNPTTPPTAQPTVRPTVPPQVCSATPPPDFPRDPNKICVPYTEITPQNNCVCAYGNWERVQRCTPQNWTGLIQCYTQNIQCGYTRYCHAKPIVYLYPENPTLVDVLLEIPGIITVSDPQYPAGGWQDVLAQPNGDLWYGEAQYPYLYYEAEVDKVNPPGTGIVIKTTHLEPMFRTILTQYGLNKKEINDFTEYWVPRLQSENKPYVLFSILDPIEKDRIDRVIINPKPETRIEISAYFKLLDAPVAIAPMALPASPPKREGFVMVEWGGTIEPQQ